MTEQEKINLGTVTVLVNVGGQVPLVLVGTVVTLTTLEFLERHHSVIIPGPKGGEEEEEFLVLDVTTATLPPGFPLTIAQLTTDVAINLDYVILILPVEVV